MPCICWGAVELAARSRPRHRADQTGAGAATGVRRRAQQHGHGAARGKTNPTSAREFSARRRTRRPTSPRRTATSAMRWPTWAAARKPSPAIGEPLPSNPTTRKPTTIMGNVLIALGRFDEAAEACQRALKIRPEYAKAHNNLATAHARQRRDEEGDPRLSPGHCRQPRFCRSLSRPRQRALWLLRRHDEAVVALERAVRLRPDDADAHISLGRQRLERATTNGQRGRRLSAPPLPCSPTTRSPTTT